MAGTTRHSRPELNFSGNCACPFGSPSAAKFARCSAGISTPSTRLWKRLSRYSMRRACIGFKREERHAGRAHASVATRATTIVTAANTLQSSGLMP